MILALLFLQTLPGDPRLDKPVVLDSELMPVGEVVKQIAKQTGLDLHAGKKESDFKVALWLKDQPASKAMAALAKALDLTWTKTEKDGSVTFTLHQSAEQVKRIADCQAAARSARVVEGEKEVRELLKNCPTDYEDQLQKAVDYRQAHPPTPDSEESGPDVPGLDAYLVGYVVKQFSEVDWKALRSGQEIQASDQNTAGFKLPPNVDRLMTLHDKLDGGFIPGTVGPDDKPAEPQNIVFKLKIDPEYGLSYGHDSSSGTEMTGAGDASPDLGEHDSPELRKAAAFPTEEEETAIVNGDEWLGKEPKPPSGEKTETEGTMHRLHLSAKANGVPYVAEVFRVSYSWDMEDMKLSSVLLSLPYSLIEADGIVTMRHRGYYNLREYEVPERLWRPLFKANPINLDAVADFMYALTDKQDASVTEMQNWPKEIADVHWDMFANGGLRFYGSLAGPQRAEAATGLSVQKMTPAQWELLNQALRRGLEGLSGQPGQEQAVVRVQSRNEKMFRLVKEGVTLATFSDRQDLERQATTNPEWSGGAIDELDQDSYDMTVDWPGGSMSLPLVRLPVPKKPK